MPYYAVASSELDKVPVHGLSRAYWDRVTPGCIASVYGPFQDQPHAEKWCRRQVQKVPGTPYSVIEIGEPVAVVSAKPYEIEVEITRREPDGQE